MIFLYPEVHEMKRDRDTFRCPYSDQVYIFKNGKLQYENSARKLINRVLIKLGLRKPLKFCNTNALHFYCSPEAKIGVRIK